MGIYRAILVSKSSGFEYTILNNELIDGFRLPDMFENVGVAASSGITTALMVVFSLMLAALLHVLGRKWRPISDD